VQLEHALASRACSDLLVGFVGAGGFVPMPVKKVIWYAAIGGCRRPSYAGESHVYHLYVVRSPERQRVREALRQRGIETMIHYPVPVHRQEGYAGLVKIGPGGLGLTERLASEVLSLPLYPELSDHEVDWVIEAVTAASGSR
jgi:dTDP-4-amino-4,6-dideoxygalactose transaminase